MVKQWIPSVVFFLIIDLLDSAGLKPLVAATESNYRKTCKKLILEGMTDDRPSIDTYHMADVCYRWRFIVFFFFREKVIGI